MDIEAKIKKNVPLAPFTTLKIGGPARFFLEAQSSDEIVAAIRWAEQRDLEFFILGGGSNILVSDQGFAGLVIKNIAGPISLASSEITAGAGAQVSAVALEALKCELTGFEWAIGLPGTVGGAVRGNAGCFNSSVQAILKSVECFDPFLDQYTTLDKVQCGFDYRSSVFQHKQLVILSATFELAPGDPAAMKAEVGRIIAFRKEHQPKEPCPGSVFKNLDTSYVGVSNADLLREAELFGKIREGRIAAGWLIDKLDLKGKTIGGAKISDLHANFIVNHNGLATANDVVMLISYVKQQVRDRYGIELHEEVQYVGF